MADNQTPIPSAGSPAPPPVPPPLYFAPPSEPAVPATQAWPFIPVAAEPDQSGTPAVEDPIQANLKLAEDKEQRAKQQAEAALQQVKEAEQQALESQTELKQQIEDASQSVKEAKEQVKEAEKKSQQSQQELKQDGGGESGDSSLTIAGYKPADLAQALVKPPEPVEKSDAAPPADPKRQKQAEQQAQQIEQTRTQIDEAEQRIREAEQFAKATEKKSRKLMDKITQLLELLSADGQPSSAKPYRVFFIIGGVLLIAALVSSPFLSGLIWITALLAAAVQLGMGFFLKKMSD